MAASEGVSCNAGMAALVVLLYVPDRRLGTRVCVEAETVHIQRRPVD